MTIYINNRKVSANWQPPRDVTSVGYIRLTSGAVLNAPGVKTIKGHAVADAETAKRRLAAVADAVNLFHLDNDTARSALHRVAAGKSPFALEGVA